VGRPTGGLAFCSTWCHMRSTITVWEANVRSLRSRAPASPALARYDDVAQILTGLATARAADGIAWVQGLCAEGN
jgi:hypothetical protein